MKYTARDESRVANIARGEVECYICHETLIKSCIFYTNKAAVFYCILHLPKSTKHSSLVILTHLLNKQIVFFDKMCQ